MLKIAPGHIVHWINGSYRLFFANIQKCFYVLQYFIKLDYFEANIKSLNF